MQLEITEFPEYMAVSFTAMASDCEVLLATQDKQVAIDIMQPAVAEIKRIEQKYSRYQPESVTSQINANS